MCCKSYTLVHWVLAILCGQQQPIIMRLVDYRRSRKTLRSSSLGISPYNRFELISPAPNPYGIPPCSQDGNADDCDIHSDPGGSIRRRRAAPDFAAAELPSISGGALPLRLLLLSSPRLPVRRADVRGACNDMSRCRGVLCCVGPLY